MVLASLAALRALARVRPTVHAPVRLVALLRVFNLTAELPDSFRARRAPSLTALVDTREAPLSGMLEYTVTCAWAVAGTDAAIRRARAHRFMVRVRTPAARKINRDGPQCRRTPGQEGPGRDHRDRE